MSETLRFEEPPGEPIGTCRWCTDTVLAGGRYFEGRDLWHPGCRLQAIDELIHHARAVTPGDPAA